MWNSILIPIFFISFVNFIAAGPPAPTTAASTAAPASTADPVGGAPTPAPVPIASGASSRALGTPNYGSLGNVAKDDHLFPKLAVTKFSFGDSKVGFFAGYQEDQLSATFKTNKKSFSFYLWPREICSVVQIRPVIRSAISDTVITFRPMEQRVVINNGTGYYYPYTKVEFTNVNKMYRITHLGQNNEHCRATFCSKSYNEIAEIQFSEADAVNIMTNNPFCSIRVNADVPISAVDTKMWTLKNLGQVDNGKDYGIAHHGRSESSQKSSVVALPGNEDGKYSKDTAGKCCPKMSELFNTDPSWTGHVDQSHVTVAEYTFKKVTAGGTDIWARELKSFLLEIKEPEKCPWIRLCFAVDAEDGPTACKDWTKTVEIFPKNGMMIRTDDDQAVMLGATHDELHTFRLEFTDADATNTRILAVRYAMASDVHTGINEFMKLKLPILSAEYKIILQRGPGCTARLNNDWQQTSLEAGKSPNQLKLKSCACYEQNEVTFSKN